MGAEQKKTNKFQAVLFLIAVPLLFAGILGFIIFTLAGEEAREVVYSIPVAGPLIKPDGEVARGGLESRIEQLKEENEGLNREIAQLVYEIEQKDQLISELEEPADSGEEPAAEAEEEEPAGDRLREMVRTLEGMTASRAADILESMEDRQAALYLDAMRTSERSQILARIDAERAAGIIALMSE
ncbi:magnesium transporter MgtE N-terminal domain-containing protein [Alteribacter natronophilus]|uniref:magnesium transporter MgtE N-terminal domain-containing protein n=1 Tax=Alteribacter natronophilus TaxID=2583810 RepID=UPI00110D5D7D|nr:hypothetical protein [Alteribacter natronophilus]TMW73216.1 hypothetical protein FGB90_02585 [Alteribacter natronophilus]